MIRTDTKTTEMKDGTDERETNAEPERTESTSMEAA